MSRACATSIVMIEPPPCGARRQEQVEEPGHVDAQVRPGTAAPCLVEVASGCGHLDPVQEVLGVEARGAAGAVHRVPRAVDRADRVGPDLGQGVLHEPDVVAGQRGVVVLGEQDVLAADLVPGLEVLPQLGVADTEPQMGGGQPLDRGRHRRGRIESAGELLAHPVDRTPLAHRDVAVVERIAAVRFRQDVVRATLHHHELGGDTGQAWHDLDRRGAARAQALDGGNETRLIEVDNV
jgi:hypothetical protein